mmetsp:Transcript_30586/g.99409  ORF Transcript_30586/g.99409 Transcript_30586/m.99409 type:complete len:218 (+) Transcript_30586:730-1383(+)
MRPQPTRARRQQWRKLPLYASAWYVPRLRLRRQLRTPLELEKSSRRCDAQLKRSWLRLRSAPRTRGGGARRPNAALQRWRMLLQRRARRYEQNTPKSLLTQRRCRGLKDRPRRRMQRWSDCAKSFRGLRKRQGRKLMRRLGCDPLWDGAVRRWSGRCGRCALTPRACEARWLGRWSRFAEKSQCSRKIQPLRSSRSKHSRMPLLDTSVTGACKLSAP